MNAVQLGALGWSELAEAEILRAGELHPAEERLKSLAAALQQHKALEPAPFLRF
jgi:hypothetical protein